MTTSETGGLPNLQSAREVYSKSRSNFRYTRSSLIKLIKLQLSFENLQIIAFTETANRVIPNWRRRCL